GQQVVLAVCVRCAGGDEHDVVQVQQDLRDLPVGQGARRGQLLGGDLGLGVLLSGDSVDDCQQVLLDQRRGRGVLGVDVAQVGGRRVGDDHVLRWDVVVVGEVVEGVFEGG